MYVRRNVEKTFGKFNLTLGIRLASTTHFVLLLILGLTVIPIYRFCLNQCSFAYHPLSCVHNLCLKYGLHVFDNCGYLSLSSFQVCSCDQTGKIMACNENLWNFTQVSKALWNCPSACMGSLTIPAEVWDNVKTRCYTGSWSLNMHQQVHNTRVYSDINKLCPYVGTIYPRSYHYPPHPEISNKDFYFAVVCNAGENSSGKFCYRRI